MNPKKNVWLAVTILLSLTVNLAGHWVSAQHVDSLEVVRARFVGNYELVRYVSFQPDGKVTPRNYVARIMYDPLGNMSAIGMPSDLPHRVEATGDERTIGGFAYFGRADIDVAAGTVTHHVIGAPMRPELVGQGRVRYYAFDGDLLTLSIKDESGRMSGQLTWRRMWAGK